jgi:hypothetical protein
MERADDTRKKRLQMVVDNEEAVQAHQEEQHRQGCRYHTKPVCPYIVRGYGFDTDYGFMIRITDLRYGFTEVRILWIANKPGHKIPCSRPGEKIRYGFLIRIADF